MGTIKLHFEAEAFQYRSGTAFPQYVNNTGTNFPVTGLAFDAATEETGYVRTRVVNYGSGNLTALLDWYADTATSGDVVWGISIAAISPNADTQDIETKAFATETTVTDSHLGTTGQRAHDISTALANLDSVAADDVVEIRVSRKASSGSDTLSGDAILTMLDISYSDT